MMPKQNMIFVRVTTESGHSWTTSINGTHEEIRKYFIDNKFDVGTYPVEKMEKVVGVDFLED
jgi:hypothetical protein